MIVPGDVDDARNRETERPLTVLMVTSEAVPFAKTGGLADVAGALPGALGRLGHDVTVVLPRYRGVAVSGEPIHTRVVQLGQDRHTVKIYEEPLGPHARAWLIDEPALFDRDGIYGTNGTGDHQDNPRRFALLARAALEGARGMGLAPDVVHAHDWQAGLAPVYLKTRFAQDPVLGGVPSVFTIHNIAYQGICDPSWLPALDLGWDLFRPEGLEFWHRVSFLKAGIVYSEKITTVSPRYAQEILTPEFAFGFEGVLASRRGDLVGILNGIDAETWNPATDRFIPKTYTADDLAPKREAKRALLEAYGFAVGRRVAEDAARRSGVADGRSEGARSDRADRARTAADRRAIRDSRHRRAALRGDVAGARARVSRSHQREDRLRRAVVARARSGFRSVHDAVAVRAVRLEPDVQPALRHAAGGACDRRARRYGGELRPVHRARHWLQVLGGVGPRVAEHAALGAPGLRSSGSLAAAAARGDGRRLVLGAFGPRIRGAVRAKARSRQSRCGEGRDRGGPRPTTILAQQSCTADARKGVIYCSEAVRMDRLCGTIRMAL